MGRPDDQQSSAPAPLPEETPVEESRAGRVVVDARGRNVWQWAKAAVDSTSILLKRLENKELALEPTQKVPVMGGAKAQSGKQAASKPGASEKPGAKAAVDRTAQKGEKKRPSPLGGKSRGDGGGGFDPYNSR